MAQPTTYTFAAPADTTGPLNIASGDYTLTIGAGDALTAPIVFTPASNAAGFFIPATQTLSDTVTSATFKFVPTAAATHTISITDSGSLTDPSTSSYTASATATEQLAAEQVMFRWAAASGADVYEVTENGDVVGRTADLYITLPAPRSLKTVYRVSAYEVHGNGRTLISSGSATVVLVPDKNAQLVTLA